MSELEDAAREYAAAEQRAVTASMLQDDAFEKASKAGTYGNVQAWHDAVREQRTASQNANHELSKLGDAAVRFAAVTE